MELIFLGLYFGLCYLLVKKLKWIPLNAISMVTMCTIPVVLICAEILLLNLSQPASTELRVFRRMVDMIPNVQGVVVDVPVEPNQRVKKGDVIYRLDPTPYKSKVDELKAQLVQARQDAKKLEQDLVIAQSEVDSVQAELTLSKQRSDEYVNLADKGAGNKFDVQDMQTKTQVLEADLAAAQAKHQQVVEELNAQVDGVWARVAAIQAELEGAQWNLDQTVMRAPADGYVPNIQLRPGQHVTTFPMASPQIFVEEDYYLVAFFDQNQLVFVEEGDDAEVSLRSHPGRVLQGKVKYIVWINGESLMPISTLSPNSGANILPPVQYAVRVELNPEDADVHLPAGAVGQCAIYTKKLSELRILRMIIIRMNAYTNWLIFKL
ncbi:HlyD family secretion protein [Ruficoccus amylovorans]|uniref:HlyD family secretion protein n=1 Tax=Ruficoccus amylovorans TaxID=1804625 RepID=A0A842HE26_9BACT|nr:biotin/lipoyl-binding protein [Ruficoccus amylovorans]MBC2594470.1 HlyD family secretion protein [Ruficoccus amylovorans]